MTASRRTAAENQVLWERIKEDQQKLGRLERDLSFCDNTDKKQLWSAVCTAKRRLIPLQVRATPLIPPLTCQTHACSNPDSHCVADAQARLGF